MSCRGSTVLLVGLLALGAPALGEIAAPRVTIADPDLVERYLASLRETREALAGYRWHARATVRIDGRDWIVQLFEARLDRDGRLRHTLTGHELVDPALDGPIRRRVVPLAESGSTAPLPPLPPLPEDEQGAALKRLAESYTHPEPADVRRVPLLPAPLTALQPLTPLGGSSPATRGQDAAPTETASSTEVGMSTSAVRDMGAPVPSVRRRLPDPDSLIRVAQPPLWVAIVSQPSSPRLQRIR